MHRWNGKSLGQKSWAVEPEDLVVACEAETDEAGMLKRLQASQHTRITLLRWLCGPAPEEDDANGSHVNGTAKPSVFEVVLEKTSGSEKLGLRLDPSARDPTRTSVAEVLTGGLVEAYNRRVVAEARTSGGSGREAWTVCPGDEVDAVNGEQDPTRFSEGCRSARIVLTLSRRKHVSAVVPPELETPLPTSFTETPAAVAAAPAVPALVAAAAATAETATTTTAVRAAAAAPPPEVVPPRTRQTLLASSTTSTSPEVVSPARPAAVAATPPPNNHPSYAAVASPVAVAPEDHRANAQAVEVASGPSPERARELFVLRAERDSLKAEAEGLRKVQNKREKAEQAERKKAQEEVQALQAQFEELRSEEQRLRVQVRRGESLQEENSRLVGENERLKAELEAAQAAARREASRPSINPQRLQPLDQSLVRLRELTASLDRALAPDVDGGGGSGGS